MYDDADISFSFLLLPPSWHSRLLLSAGEAAGGMEEEEGGEGEQDDYPAGRGKKEGEAGGGQRFGGPRVWRGRGSQGGD